jgi:hypothetical protein
MGFNCFFVVVGGSRRSRGRGRADGSTIRASMSCGRTLRARLLLCSPVPGRDTDYRTKTFSCCRCGTDGALAITEPNRETGMTDYQLDQVEGPQHHPGAVAQLTGQPTPAYRLSAKHYGVKAYTLTTDGLRNATRGGPLQVPRPLF